MSFGAIGQYAIGEEDGGVATVTIYGIAYTLSEPVRVPPRLNPALNPAFFAPELPTPNIMGWFSALSVPRELKKTMPTAQRPFRAVSGPVNPVVTMPWYMNLSTPKRTTRDMRTSLNPFLARAWIVPRTGVISRVYIIT